MILSSLLLQKRAVTFVLLGLSLFSPCLSQDQSLLNQISLLVKGHVSESLIEKHTLYLLGKAPRFTQLMTFECLPANFSLL